MNFGTIIGLVNTAISACFQWFTRLMNTIGAYNYVIAGITVMIVFRFIVFPVVSGRAVNTGDHKKSKEE